MLHPGMLVILYIARTQALLWLSYVLQAAVLPRVSQLSKPLKQLNIPVYCLYGTGVPTENGYYYKTPHFSTSAPDAPANVTHGDGDGTVNIESLQACEQCALAAFWHLCCRLSDCNR